MRSQSTRNQGDRGNRVESTHLSPTGERVRKVKESQLELEKVQDAAE